MISIFFWHGALVLISCIEKSLYQQKKLNGSYRAFANSLKPYDLAYADQLKTASIPFFIDDTHSLSCQAQRDENGFSLSTQKTVSFAGLAGNGA